MSTCKHGQLARSCGTCELESENAALTARVTQLEQRLEINRAVLAGARNCILKYVPASIQSDRDFTLSSIKLKTEVPTLYLIISLVVKQTIRSTFACSYEL